MHLVKSPIHIQPTYIEAVQDLCKQKQPAVFQMARKIWLPQNATPLQSSVWKLTQPRRGTTRADFENMLF